MRTKISVMLTCSSDDNLSIWAACLIFLGVIIGSDCNNIDEESWCFLILGSAHGPPGRVVQHTALWQHAWQNLS